RVTKCWVYYHQSALLISLYTLLPVLSKSHSGPNTIWSAKGKWLRSSRMQCRILREYSVPDPHENADQLWGPKPCSTRSNNDHSSSAVWNDVHLLSSNPRSKYLLIDPFVKPDFSIQHPSSKSFAFRNGYHGFQS